MSSIPQPVHSQSSRPTARRRDGITLAATGAIPQRVRGQILADHHADLTARARTQVRAAIEAGRYPLRIPYGYRNIGPSSPDAHADSGRAGRAPALQWGLDHDCANVVETMSRYVQYAMTPAQVARVLNLDRDVLPLLTVSGRQQRWTGRSVRSLLTDPVLTGHSVWGRTHHGRPQPRHAWIISTGRTHPPILDAATFLRMVEILLGAPSTTARITTARTAAVPTVTAPSSVCAAGSRWHR